MYYHPDYGWYAALWIHTLYHLSQLQHLDTCFCDNVTMDDLSVEALAQEG